MFIKKIGSMTISGGWPPTKCVFYRPDCKLLIMISEDSKELLT